MNPKASLPDRLRSHPWAILTAMLFLAVAGPAPAKPLSDKDVSLLLNSGYPPAQIVETLRKEGYEGPTDNETLSRLRAAGATRDLIAALSTYAQRAGAPAAKDESFTNSLGMKFVPVPGTKVLFCIHPTRKSDYRAFAEAKGNLDNSWKDVKSENVPVSEKEDHPVVNVSWDDAKAFCQWLSEKEGRKYRLPTDHEWSCAVGIGDREIERWAPQIKDKIPGVYPWGTQWPPPLWAGNFADSAFQEKLLDLRLPSIEGYDDGYATTSPVMSFTPNALGLFDMTGNVEQWCENLYHAAPIEVDSRRVVRGAPYNSHKPDDLLSSHRESADPRGRIHYRGFRVVVEK